MFDITEENRTGYYASDTLLYDSVEFAQQMMTRRAEEIKQNPFLQSENYISPKKELTIIKRSRGNEGRVTNKIMQHYNGERISRTGNKVMVKS